MPGRRCRCLCSGGFEGDDREKEGRSYSGHGITSSMALKKSLAAIITAEKWKDNDGSPSARLPMRPTLSTGLLGRPRGLMAP